MTWVRARHIPLLLAAATLLPIVAFSWLGLRTLRQDRELEGQRQREQLELAAGRLALGIEKRIQDIEDRLAKGDGMRFLTSGIESSRERPVVFQPLDLAAPASSIPALASAEAAEYLRRDFTAAEGEYIRVAATQDHSARAAALLGLARVRRAQKNYTQALVAYDDLERLGSVVVAGQPAALVARQGRCRTLELAGERERLHDAVRDLTRALESGEWRIDRATFDLYRQLLVQWGGELPASSSVARTEIAADLWQTWRRGELESKGRRVFVRGSITVIAVWSATSENAAIWIEPASMVEELWRSLWREQGLSVALSDVDGRRFIGPALNRSVSLTPSETRLPFVLTVSSIASPEGLTGTRRQLLVSGLLLAQVLMIAAAYVVYRTTTKELALARQQADFVSAVSHEFRTPLTSMRHLTELLVSRSVTTEERKAQYYELLARETERLHRMVESLLSFGRMENAAYTWQLESADVDRIVSQIVDEFRVETLAAGRQVSCEIAHSLPPIRADREALSRALWNLLENAAKYSEAGTPIHVFAKRQGDTVLLGVRDEGIGIPPVDQRRIFQKFVRGSEATRAGIRGVGLGLALVTRIVEAHGGSVRLDSVPGRGSTFTLVIPCLES